MSRAMRAVPQYFFCIISPDIALPYLHNSFAMLSGETVITPGSILCFYSKCKCLKISEINPYLLSIFQRNSLAINKIHGIVCIVNGSDDDTARKTKKPTTEAKMSTRCAIGMKREDGEVAAIYCHNEGYPEGVGAILGRWYRNAEKWKPCSSWEASAVSEPNLNRKLERNIRFSTANRMLPTPTIEIAKSRKQAQQSIQV